MITLLRRCHHLFKKIERVRLIVRMITGRLGKYGKIKIIFLKVIENLLFTKNLVEKRITLNIIILQTFSYLSLKLTKLN